LEEKMKKIPLEIPAGPECDECIFLDQDYRHNTAHCKLFKAKLYVTLKYGGIKCVDKCEDCPRDYD
jgi:hypothetical protein